MIQLLAITPPTGRIDPDVVGAWVDAGIHTVDFAVLLRDPSAGALAAIAPEGRLHGLWRVCLDRGITMLVSCNVADLRDISAKLLEPWCGGVQLKGDPSASDVRAAREQLAAPSHNASPKWVGRSVHGLPDGAATSNPADYTCVAPIFVPRTPSPDREKHPIGLEGLRAWSRPGTRGLIALGGISSDVAQDCITAGAQGLASIHAFFGDATPVRTEVEALRNALGSV